MLRNRLTNTLVALTVFAAIPAVTAGPFDQGKTHFSLVIGAGTAFNQSYTIVGGGLDYFVLHGLQLGVDAQAWYGGDNSIYKVSPQLRYVLDTGSSLKPYVGAFYRKTFIENFDNLESTGGRVGAYINTGASTQMSAGYVFENYLNCDNSVFNNCSDSYPELTISFAL